MWDNATYRAMAHPIKRRIITCLQDRDLSFTELLNAVVERNHGNFGHHLRTLKGFVELEFSTGKYRLTHRGRLLCACIRDFRFITSVDKKLTDYVQNLEMGDHAVGFYTTEDFKHKISFPFLKAGLSKGEAVLYLVAEDELDSEMHEIQRYGIDLDCKGAFTVMSADEWYLKKVKPNLKQL